MPVLELTAEERNSLIGILKVEQSDLEDLISNETNEADKEGLQIELKRVNSMLDKLS